MKVGVIMGGISSERAVSLKSGEEVVKYLNRNKYEVIPIVIDSKKQVVEKVQGIDFAFIALHGKFGEDGTIQGILEALEIPYSGCSVLTSAICMNKGITKSLLQNANINTAPWITVKSVEEIDYEKIKSLGYPVFIKPNNGGSSVATFCVKDEGEVEKAVKEGLKYDTEVMIEKYIKGEEITSFILNGEVFPTVMIETKSSGFFDYTAKYDDNGAEENVVYLKEQLQSQVAEISKKIWDLLYCRSYSRVDMIISNGIPYVLEVNTLPGLTPHSLIPKSAKAKGMEFSELLDKIIKYSLV
ncbi:D-alanine--D-alanine ligase [Clostridium cellulovorans]|uniref:D-alanine--D-alanine ligase n=1 Tax=Clostridium cellulovorans (strain ATCC 35296 / DSM 3052 / OCM 3 / 743B) TaxID=573061 RepID=D9SUR5_CLOC7|nr:D-alanine--D-alanine ligase [Clostridium cellulovorans]ADL50970.1 D-alanine/D-alanine ligase [Clostridium cellulovorans 743B]